MTPNQHNTRALSHGDTINSVPPRGIYGELNCPAFIDDVADAIEAAISSLSKC